MKTKSKRLETTFATLKSEKRKALIPFITSGDPEGCSVTAIMHALVRGGADIIELGIPFSDPAADGPTIQSAGERAIANGMCLHDSLAAVTAFRKEDNKTPVVLMGYLNSAEAFTGGFLGFAKALQSAAVDAVILVDLSYESGAKYRQILRQYRIDPIPLIAPTTTKTRLAKIVGNAGGFVYYVSMRGTTGAGDALDYDEVNCALARIKNKTDLPVCVGFGIADGETAKAMAHISDGVVVGSALVKKLYNASQNKENVPMVATDFMTSLRQSLDGL